MDRGSGGSGGGPTGGRGVCGGKAHAKLGLHGGCMMAALRPRMVSHWQLAGSPGPLTQTETPGVKRLMACLVPLLVAVACVVGPPIQADRSTCPMKGRRAPQLAAGDAEKLALQVQQFASVDVVACTADGGLTPPQRQLLLDAWETGTNRALLSLRLKFACWRQLPWHLAGKLDQIHSVQFFSQQLIERLNEVLSAKRLFVCLLICLCFCLFVCLFVCLPEAANANDADANYADANIPFF